MKAQKNGGVVTIALAALVAVGISGCGGLPISLSAVPNPALVAHPLTFTTQLKNTLSCDAVDPVIVFVPLVPENDLFNQLCQFLTQENLDALCGMVETQAQADAVADACCRFTDFQAAWPTSCLGLHAGGSIRERLRNFPLQDSLTQNSIETHADFSASATTALGALSCTSTTIVGLPALDCTGTLAPGDTATASLTITPTTLGTFGTIAIAFADASPCGVLNTAEGGACLSTSVEVPAPAPLLSGRGLIVLAGLLGVVAFVTLATQRRRSPGAAAD